VERTREYRGRYHVLHGVLSPLEGIRPDRLGIRELLRRLENGSEVQAVSLATNRDAEGEATALYLTKLLRPIRRRVTRIAQADSTRGRPGVCGSANTRESAPGP